MKIKADIVDYMGRYETGILVLINVGVDDEFYEGTIFYSDKDIVLTVDNSIEEKLGSEIELWDGYKGLIESILSKLIPYDEISKRVDEVDFEKYVSYYEEDLGKVVIDEIKPDEIIVATQSNLPQ
jgi:hypothetical protein